MFCNFEMNDSSAKLSVGGGGFLRALLTNQGGRGSSSIYIYIYINHFLSRFRGKTVLKSGCEGELPQ